MKAHYKYRFWFVSLLVHLCLVMVLSVIIINQTTPNNVDALEVSILKVKPVPPVQKTPRIEAPPIAPTPTPNFQIERLSASVQTRAFTSHPVKSTAVSMPKAAAVDAPVSRSPAQSVRAAISVQGASQSSRANNQPAQLATAVDLPLQSDAPLAAGLSGSSSFSGTGSIGEGRGSGVGRGSFGSGGGVGQTRTRGRVGIGSLVGAEGASNIDDTLSDVTEMVRLGDEVAELPPGSPGAIVVGRGRDIMGRLNLARFEDPLHPSADI